jgi:4-alpha-glucanotransferase
MIPAEAETAIEGFWQNTPGDELLHELQHQISDLPIVAEDLGMITPEVIALRDKYELPGMSVLQFAFDGFDDNPHKPKNITRNTVVYTGTHDNNTTTGWFNELDKSAKEFVFQILGIEYREDIANCLVETALHSRANTAMIPLQDLLELGSESRMNIPGETDNNWQWKFKWEQIQDQTCARLKYHISLSGRLHAD